MTHSLSFCDFSFKTSCPTQETSSIGLYVKFLLYMHKHSRSSVTQYFGQDSNAMSDQPSTGHKLLGFPAIEFSGGTIFKRPGNCLQRRLRLHEVPRVWNPPADILATRAGRKGCI